MKQNLLKTMLVGIGMLAGTVGAMADEAEATVKMTYVNYDAADTSYGEIATGESASTGYNKISNGSVAFANTKWGMDCITYLQVDASAIDGTITNVTLSATFDAKDRAHTYGIGYNSSTWSSDMTYNTADKTITTVGSTQSISSSKGKTNTSTLTFDITDAFTNDEDKIVTLLIYDLSAGGGHVSNPTATITYSSGAAVTYTINYKCDGSTVKMVTENSAVGVEITADTLVYDSDNNRYLIVDDTAPSLTLTSSNNILDVNVRKPYTATLKVTNNIAGVASDPVSTTFEESNGKECSWSYAYSLYTQKDGVYYIADNTEAFGETGIFSNNETIERTVTYAQAVEDVVYFNEAENLSTTDVSTGDYSQSNGGSAAAKSTTGISLGNFTAGSYEITTVITANEHRNFVLHDASKGKDVSLFSTAEKGSVSGTFTLDADAELIVTGYTNSNNAYNQSARFDYILIKYTGTTGIAQTAAVKPATENAYYNLSGQRVAQPVKGLYIVNGKKVVVR